MEIQIRRGKFLNHGADLFEWQPSKSNNIFLHTNGLDRVREFFNALYNGETLRTKARYWRGIKVLAIEWNGGDKA